MTKTRSYRMAALGFVVTTVGCAAHVDSDDSSNGDEPLATVGSEIINGLDVTTNSLAVAALYKLRSNGKWSFTCSGTVLNPGSSVKAILTARHCVTTDGEIDGPLAAASDRRVTGLVSPGYEPANVITNFQTGMRLVAHSTRDIAILWIAGDIGLPNLGNYMPFGLSLAPTSSFVGDYINQYGYGLNVPSTSDPTPAQRATAGYLRWGGLFELLSAGSRSYTYGNPSEHPNAYEVTYGDSGGPSALAVSPSPAISAYYQLGVHSTKGASSGTDVSIAGNWGWIRDQLTYVFLRNLQFDGRRAYWADVNNKTLVTTVQSTIDNWHSRLVYDTPAKTIQVWASQGWSGKCIDLQWNNTADGTPFWLWSCSGGSAQRFIVTADHQLEMEGHPGKCLEETTDHRLVVQTCTRKAAQTWMFDHNPGQ